MIAFCESLLVIHKRSMVHCGSVMDSRRASLDL